jgi:hypothetical protein
MPSNNKKAVKKMQKVAFNKLLSSKGILPSLQKRRQRQRRPRNVLATGPASRGNAPRGQIGLSDFPRGVTSRRMQTIAEDEYIGEIVGSTGFATTAYSLNPGQTSTFPWGARIASLYEEYEYESVEFYYKREVSEFATGGTVGKVILSFDYDATDTAPTSKQQVEDTVPHIDGMPSDPVILLRLDCSRIKKNPSKYVRPGAQPANTDLKLYDAGNFYVSTYGNSSNGVLLGELRVRYRVKLSEPVLENSQLAGGILHYSGTVPTTANMFATAALQSGGSPYLANAGFILTNTGEIIFPAGVAGNYLIELNITASTSVTAITPSSFAGGVANINLFTSTTRDADGGIASLASTVGYSSMVAQTITVPASGGGTSFNQPTIVGGIGMDLWIIALPFTVLTVVNPLTKMLYDMQAQLASFENRLSVQVDDEAKESDWNEVDPNHGVVLSSDRIAHSKFALPPIAVPTAFRASPSSKVK